MRIGLESEFPDAGHDGARRYEDDFPLEPGDFIGEALDVVESQACGTGQNAAADFDDESSGLREDEFSHVASIS